MTVTAPRSRTAALPQPQPPTHTTMLIQDFFTTSDGKTAKLYSLTNAHGFQVDVTDFGGVLVNLFTPDRDGKPTDVLLGFRNPADFEANPPYFGQLVGRLANRLAGARFSLDGKDYQLECNDGGNRPNALHGVLCYGRRLWNATPLDDATLQLTLVSPDGDAGFPGTVSVTVVYHVTDDNSLDIQYTATTDAPTVVNLTNHAYFNLNGRNSARCDHHTITSTAYAHTEVNENLIPTGRILPVDNSPFDLRAGRTFEDIYNDPRLPIAFDDNFIVADQAGTLQRNVFTVASSQTGITLEVDTDQPGVQLYMGYWLDGSCIGKAGKPYERFASFCLETQLWPDAPNHPDFPSARLNPSDTYTHHTIYRFGVQK